MENKVTVQAQTNQGSRKWEIIPAETITVYGEVKYDKIAKLYMVAHPEVTEVRLEKNGCGQGHYFFRSDVIGK